MTGSRRSAGAAAALALACATLVGDPLAGLHPYVLPWRERVVLLTCRWETQRPLRVALPEDATADERRAIERVLAAWEGAGLGVRFEADSDEPADIQLALVAGAVRREGDLPGSGLTVADCRAQPGGAAELVHARVVVARTIGPDWRGRERELSPGEFAGTLFHELGHALGFQGHARGEGDPMARSVDATRRAGARVLRGEDVQSAALRALYARPSGTVLREARTSRWRSEEVDRMAALAARKRLDGPFLRVGDASARVFWRDASGEEYGFLIPNLAETLGDPTRILVIPEAGARRLLPRRSHAAPAPRAAGAREDDLP